MALQLPHSQFFHIPRTGGFFVRKALTEAGVATNEICQTHSDYYHRPGSAYFKRGTILHMKPTELFQQGHKRFTIVRYPVGWLRSYFKHRVKYGWNMYEDIDLECKADTFEEFIDRYLKRVPGYYSHLVSQYDKVDFVGRTENLNNDLVAILKACGESFDKQKIINAQPYNTTTGTNDELPNATRDALIKADRYVIDRYYADGQFVH